MRTAGPAEVVAAARQPAGCIAGGGRVKASRATGYECSIQGKRDKGSSPGGADNHPLAPPPHTELLGPDPALGWRAPRSQTHNTLVVDCRLGTFGQAIGCLGRGRSVESGPSLARRSSLNLFKLNFQQGAASASATSSAGRAELKRWAAPSGRPCPPCRSRRPRSGCRRSRRRGCTPQRTRPCAACCPCCQRRGTRS